MKIKNLVEESIKEVSKKINVLSNGELSKEEIALIGEYSSLNEKLINVATTINIIEEHEKKIKDGYKKELTNDKYQKIFKMNVDVKVRHAGMLEDVISKIEKSLKQDHRQVDSLNIYIGN